MLSDGFYKIKDVILRKMINCHCSRKDVCKLFFLLCLHIHIRTPVYSHFKSSSVFIIDNIWTVLYACFAMCCDLRASVTSDKEHLKPRCSLPACVSCLSVVSTAHFYPQYITRIYSVCDRKRKRQRERG